MKKFDINAIRSYIEAHKHELSCVLCGYIESWLFSTKAVFCNGNYVLRLSDLNTYNPDETERTPYMKAIFNDGSIYIHYM